jgi:aminopeptidase N
MRAPRLACGPVLLLSSLLACGGDGGHPTGELAITVTRYELDLDLESRVGHARLELTAESDGDCLTLPVRADVDLASVTLEEVGAPGGTVATATVAGGALEVCGRGWPTGTALALEADVEIPLETLEDSQVGYSLARDVRGNDFWFLISWVGGCDRFAPCDNRADAFATYEFTVTHPEDVLVRCPGVITEVSASETTCTFDYDGGPTYSTFGLTASSGWEITDLGDWDGVQVSLYDTGSPIPGMLDEEFHAGMLAWMSDTFGPYPYGDELRILTAPTYWAGFEHPGNIVLADTLAGGAFGSYNIKHTLNHELAHQWAGDQTTLADTYDFVWKEAMAEYLSFVYEDETAGTGAMSLTTARSWRSGASGAAYFPVPAEEPRLFDYYGDAYGPGPMVLFRQLEAMTSRAAIIEALQSVLGTPRALSVEELRAALEDATGLDLAAYFDAWVYGTGAPTWPEVTVAWTQDPKTGDVAVEVEHVNAAAAPGPCAFHVALDGDGDGEQALVAIDLRDGASQSIELPDPGFVVTSDTLDPLAECLVYRPIDALQATPRHGPGWSPWRAPRD